MYEVFEHTADVGLRIDADSIERLLIDAGRGLASLLVADPETVRPVEQRRLRINGAELDYLLFDWLTELLYLFSTDRLILTHFAIQRDENGFDAVAQGEPIDLARHQMEHEVKAITYHALVCRPTPDGRFEAEVIVDI